jgi:N-acetylglutamate synthase-like GNAT family acetyltransferase
MEQVLAREDLPEQRKKNVLTKQIDQAKEMQEKVSLELAALQAEYKMVLERENEQEQEQQKIQEEIERKKRICNCCGLEILAHSKCHLFGELKICNSCYVTGNATKLINKVIKK